MQERVSILAPLTRICHARNPSLQALQLLLRSLLGLLRDVGVGDGGLQTADDVAGLQAEKSARLQRRR